MKTMYMSRFFQTLEEAESFQKQHGGALYRLKAKVKKGHGPNNYKIEAIMRGLTEADMKSLPYCVAWNQK